MSFFDDEDEDQAPAAAPPPAVPGDAASPDFRGPPVPDAMRQQRVQQYLQSKFAPKAEDDDAPAPTGLAAASDDSAVKAARDDARRNNRIDALGQAAEGLFKAKSMALGGQGVNTAFWQQAREGNQQPVADAESDRKTKIQQYLQQRQMGREDIADKQSAAEFGQKQKGWDVENEANDPASKKSQMTQALFAKALGPQYMEQLKGMSANDIQQYAAKPLELKAKLDETRATHALAGAQREANTLDKEKTKKSEAYKSLRHDLETFRGNSAVQQANQNILSADNALANAKGKDPNSWTTQDLSLLSSEMAKVATGGVPTEHGQQALMPSNLQTKFAEMQNFLSSKPTDAQAGEYVKKNLAYLEEMQKVAKDTVHNYRANIAKGYKNLVSPEDLDEAMTDYGLKPGTAPTGQPSASVGQPPPAALPPKDGFAVMTSPKGKQGYIPTDKVKDAQAAGFK